MTDDPVGLDTSVVLRLLMEEPPELAALARDFVQRAFDAKRCLRVTDLVVSEAYFALQAHYNVPKRDAAEELLYFLSLPQIQAVGVAPQALRAVLEGPSKPGLVDRMIHLEYLPATLVTFEKAASRLEGALVLK